MLTICEGIQKSGFESSMSGKHTRKCRSKEIRNQEYIVFWQLCMFFAPLRLEEVGFVLAAFERVTVLRLDGRRDSPTQSDGVHRGPFAEAFQDGHLRH